MHEKKNILRIVKKIMPSHRFTSLEKLTEKERSVIGLGLIGLALLTGLLMYYQQGALRVPVFIAITALSIFLIAGVAILIYGKVSKEKYHQMIESLILFMCVIPLWIAFDPAEKQCRANLIFLSGEISCRLGFALGGFILLIFLFLSFTGFGKKR